ncbi:MAG TPA: glycosyltransferase family 9 protein, partial [Gammaproteobacteria bacterium]
MQPLFAAAVPAPRIAGVTAPPWPPRVAVFRALQLGDLLCAVPALRAVRAAMPNAHITLIGLPWARDFARRFRHYVDDFLDFTGAPGLIERTPAPGEYAAFLAAAQARRFDLALQLHGDGSHSNAVVRALGARYTVGCHPAETAAADPRYSLEYPEQLPEIRRLLAPLAHVGIAARGEQLEFPVTAEDEAALDAAWPQRGHGRYICLHPGARMPSRRWPAAYFARIAVACAEAGYVPVFTGSAD